MADDTTEFSLHEMENIKRKMSHIETSRENSITQNHQNTPFTENIMVHDDMYQQHQAPGQQPHLSQQVAQQQTSQIEEGESLHFRRSLRVLHRHLLIIFFIIIVTPSIIWVIDTQFRPKMYISKTMLEQLDEAQSRDIVIGAMRLSARRTDVGYFNKIIQNEEFDQQVRLLLNTEIQRLKNAIKKSKDVKSRYRKTIMIHKLEKMVGDITKKIPNEYYKYRGSISGSYIDEETISLSVKGASPDILKLVADSVVIAANKIARTERISQIADFRDQLIAAREQHNRQLADVRKKIDEITSQITEKDVDLGTKFSIVNQLQMEEHKNQVALSELELKMKHLKQQINWDKIKTKFFITNEQDIRFIMVKGNPLRESWRSLLRTKEEMPTKYTSEHPKYQQVERDIAAVIKQLKTRGNVTSSGQVPPLPSLQEEELFAKISELDFKIPLAKLRLEAATKKLNGEKKKEKMDTLSNISDPKEKQKMRMLKDKRNGLIQERESHQAASLEKYRRLGEIDMLLNQVSKERKFRQPKLASPAQLISPRVSLDVALGLMLGIVLGCSVAFLIESVDNKFHTPFDVYYHLKLNYLGVIPKWNEKERTTISPENPDSHISEIYAHLRNNIRYGRGGSPEKCLLVASATQSEGKSTICANIATSYALEGNNVVLIDADLRRPRGHKLIEIFHRERPIKYGLADYLTGGVDFDEIIYNTAVPGLSLIPAGSRVRNPAKLMGSAEMQALIDRAEESFDIVIIDCPAVLPVVDATTLSGRVRGVLMVIAAEEVEIAAVKMALYRLQHVGSPIVGAVLNKVCEKSTSYYYYGYRYRSGYYYSPYSEPYVDGGEESEA